MNNQRFFLYIALAFVMYLIWLTWQQEHTPKEITQQFDEQNEIQKQNILTDKSEDIPDASTTENFDQVTENVERKPTDQ